MSSTTKKDMIYYSIVIAVITPLIYGLTLWLNWPLLATLVFGGALFIHLIYMSKHSKDFFFRIKQDGFSLNSVSGKFGSLLGITAKNNESET
ncbi:hypothetical protein [Rhodohalobacter sp.]|uniref:hypothetical protein n=1 Tax=Rhodohalobacter sp. TaxID=1974210 RepID=UPI003565274A